MGAGARATSLMHMMRKRLSRMVTVGVLGCLMMAGCSGDIEPVPTVTVTETVTVPPPTEAAPVTPDSSTLVKKIRSTYPGYPLVVDTGSVDYRVASSFETSPQLVALAPGVYTSYNESVTELDVYVDEAPVSGDCTLINSLFADRGGSCWDGVKAGTQEPAP